MLGRYDYRVVLFNALEVVPDLDTGDGVEAGGRFVEEDEAAFGEGEDGEAEGEFSLVAQAEVLSVGTRCRTELNFPFVDSKQLKMLFCRQILYECIGLKT